MDRVRSPEPVLCCCSQYQLQLEGAKEQKEEAEKKRRGAREKMLEGAGKIWDGIKSTGEKVIKPFQSIWSKILGFISTIFFGRIFYKILEWMGNKDNHGKIQSIIQFLKLLVVYFILWVKITSQFGEAQQLFL